MEKPNINENCIESEFTNSGFDVFFNSNQTGVYGRIVKDLVGRKFCVRGFYIDYDFSGYYLVGAEDEDPCRIAYEIGELTQIDFWSRFGFIWEAIPTLSGGCEINRIPIHNVKAHIHFGWCQNRLSPIESCNEFFSTVLTKWDPKSPDVIAAKKNYPLFQIALELRQKQWDELMKKSA